MKKAVVSGIGSMVDFIKKDINSKNCKRKLREENNNDFWKS